jgi:hypothetical protein
MFVQTEKPTDELEQTHALLLLSLFVAIVSRKQTLETVIKAFFSITSPVE